MATLTLGGGSVGGAEHSRALREIDRAAGEGKSLLLEVLESSVGGDVATLRALLGISQAVMGARYLTEALEAIAEHSLAALEATEFSISRWDTDRHVLRTLINVGQLSPHEKRWPTDEVYPVADFPWVGDLLREGRPYVHSVEDYPADAVEVKVVRALNMSSALAVPVSVGGVTWGEMWAARSGGLGFGADDVRLLQAISAQLSVAIGTADAFSVVSTYAYEDPLTGLANRRALHKQMSDRAAEAAGGPTLLVADVDGLKTVNDRDGHPAGDELLLGVADALSSAAATVPGALVARLGGDEFCIMLPQDSVDDARGMAIEVSRRIAADLSSEVSLCWGIATRGDGTTTDEQLLAAADTVMMEAKRLGPGRLATLTAQEPVVPAGVTPRRADAPSRRVIDGAVGRVVALIDERPDVSTLHALELLARELSSVGNAVAWVISETTPDGSALRAVSGWNSLPHPDSGLRLLDAPHPDAYLLDDYPATAKALADGNAFLVAVDRPDSDPAEVDVLHLYGYSAGVVIGGRCSGRGYLIELYADGPYDELALIVPYATVLMHYLITRLADR